MKRDVDISPKHLISNEDYEKVVAEEKNEAVAKAGVGTIVFTMTCALAAAIIFASCANVMYKKNQLEELKNSKKTESVITPAYEDPKEAPTQTNSEEQKEEVKYDREINITIKELDYSNVSTFYNHIMDNRSKYGSFADSFQSEEDVKNFINFLYKFDELYNDTNTDTPIDSQEYYDRIIQDYYGSCVKHDVKGELNLLYSNNPLAQEKVAEAESLAFDLKNGKGNDYTIADRYYTWMLENLIDDRTRVDINMENAPFIDALREQFEQYRYSGNMLNARKYQKNDSLPVESIHLYYADEAPEGVEVTEIQNSFTCPDWGVDNVISKYEEDTETRLYIKRDGQGTFYRVDEAFDTVLNRGKVK